ncbi:MAG: helix-turn-helix transcriptional regulator [Gammaproteobacteria bacterium]
MPDTLHRQWVMLNCIPAAPRKISTTDLQQTLNAEGFSIDVRSLQRDLITLSGRFPLVCDMRGKPYGWSWRKDARSLQIPGMSPQTALTLKLAHALLEPLLPHPAMKALSGQLETANKVLQDLSNSALREWPQKVRIIPAGLRRLAPRIDNESFYIAQEALLTGRYFKARYSPRDDSGKKTDDYEINPLGIVVRAPVIYLVCTLFDYTDIRQLAIHRLSRGRLLDKRVKKPKDFNLDAYIESQAFDMPSGKNIQLRALFDSGAAFHLHETPLSTDQKIVERSDGRVLLTATVQNTAQLHWWLLGFGAQVEILGPTFLRKEFRQVSLDMQNIYRRRPSS